MTSASPDFARDVVLGEKETQLRTVFPVSPMAKPSRSEPCATCGIPSITSPTCFTASVDCAERHCADVMPCTKRLTSGMLRFLLFVDFRGIILGSEKRIRYFKNMRSHGGPDETFWQAWMSPDGGTHTEKRTCLLESLRGRSAMGPSRKPLPRKWPADKVAAETPEIAMQELISSRPHKFGSIYGYPQKTWQYDRTHTAHDIANFWTGAIGSTLSFSCFSARSPAHGVSYRNRPSLRVRCETRAAEALLGCNDHYFPGSVR